MVDIHRWGPAAWTFLYAAAFKFPDDPTPEQREGATHFFHGLQTMLPCHECQQHYGQYQQEFPIEHNVGGRNQLCAWLLGLNNRVNANTGKPAVTLGEVWHDLVEDGPMRHSRFCASLVCVVICGLALLVALMYWRRK
jgi:hypothetical protein